MQTPTQSPHPKTIPAAQYLRMSTEHQQYSTDNQATAIKQYAVENGFEIVATYADEGVSGVTASRRKGLLRLLEDVEAKQHNFQAILVYDVSRWGRFQDPDDAAIYEVRCRWAGVPVHYCAEHFQNDGSVVSSIMKALKRAMAAEFSRELSTKVTQGHTRMLGRGFHQGGIPSFGMQRVLIDASGNRKGVLLRGQRKNIQSDRIILEPGPPENVVVVNELYSRYLTGETQRMLIDDMNSRGIQNAGGTKWGTAGMHKTLTSEAYIGNMVWGKSTRKLGTPKRRTPTDEWIRKENAFAPVVEPELYWAVQAEIRRRAFGLTKEELLQVLGRIYRKHGTISKKLIDNDGATTAMIIVRRFGSIRDAFHQIAPGSFPSNIESKITQRVELSGRRLAGKIMRQMGADGPVASNAGFHMINNSGSTIVVAAARYVKPFGKADRWFLQWASLPEADAICVARMAPGNERIRDYLVLSNRERSLLASQRKRDTLSPLVPFSRRSLQDAVKQMRTLLDAVAYA